MNELGDRASLLAAVRSLWDDIEAIVAAAAERTGPPRSDEAWTFNDLLAHLTSWRLLTAARLEAAQRGTEPVVPWPASLDEDENLDEINQYFFETNRDKPRSTLVRESRETLDRVSRALAQLPEQDLFEVGRFPWLAGYALGPAVIAGTVEHFREHEPELRALLARENDVATPNV